MAVLMLAGEADVLDSKSHLPSFLRTRASEANIPPGCSHSLNSCVL